METHVRLSYFLILAVVLASCTKEQAKQDGQAVYDQVKEDAQFAYEQASQDFNQASSQVQRHTQRIADATRDGIKRTNRRARDWWLTDPPPPLPPNAVPTSYCYTVLQDVVCYRAPMPGWEHRLVAYQGTGAEPPPPAVMKPLPSRNINTSSLSSSRVESTKPVFVGLPLDVKEDTKEEDESISPDSSDALNENLPDPTASPQL